MRYIGTIQNDNGLPPQSEGQSGVSINEHAHSYDPESAAKSLLISGLVYKANDTRLAKQLRAYGQTFTTFDSASQRGMVCASNKAIWVVFEGSDFFSPSDYLTNLHHTHVAHPLSGHVHVGFSNRMWEKITSSSQRNFSRPLRMIDAMHDQLVAYCTMYPQAEIHFVGHSSGGVSSILQAAHLANISPEITRRHACRITTFGQPRVGDGTFMAALHEYFPSYERFVLASDKVPLLPPTYKLPRAQHGYYVHGGTEHVLPAPSRKNTPKLIGSDESDASTPKPLVSIKHGIHGLKSLPRRGYNALRATHGTAAYLTACLAPLNISGAQFAKQVLLSANGDSPDRTFLNYYERDYVLHTLDVMEHLQRINTPACDSEIWLHTHTSLRHLLTENISEEVLAAKLGAITLVLSHALQQTKHGSEDIAQFQDYLDSLYAAAIMSSPVRTRLESIAYSLKPEIKTFNNDIDKKSAETYSDEIYRLLLSEDEMERNTTLSHLLRHVNTLCSHHTRENSNAALTARLAEECLFEFKARSPSLNR
jgi:Lipase (class 3)